MDSRELITVLLTAMAPVAELRGAIPLGIVRYDLPPLITYALAVVGNMIPIVPILFFLKKGTDYAMRYPRLESLLNWVFKRTRKKGGVIEKYELLGLVLFVAIPLPMTGAWTGAIASYLFGLNSLRSVISIFIGVLIAGVIVTTLSLGYKII